MKFMPPLNRVAPGRSRKFAVTLTVTAALTTLAAGTGTFALHPARAAENPQTSSAHTLRPTIAVLRGGEIDDSGRPRKETGRDSTDALNLAELAISRSHSYSLYARDLMAEQVKEIKLDSEGFVNPASAQKFGKGAGIEQFLQVFVSRPSAQPFVGENVSEYAVPGTGDPVTGFVYIPPSQASGGIFGIKTRNASPPNRRNLVRATATIMCRFTKVSTGETQVESYKGIATADAGHNNDRRLIQAAIQAAFDNFTLELSKNRTAMKASVIGIDKGMAIVNLGSDDGLKVDQAFEVCEVETIGGFDTYNRICDARVSALHPNAALLELGDYKKELFHSNPSFHASEDKAKLVHKGCIIQEKKF